MPNFGQLVHAATRMAKQRALGVKRRKTYTWDKEALDWIKRHEEVQIEKKGNWSDGETAKASPSKLAKTIKTKTVSKPQTVKTKTVKDRKWRFMAVDY